MTNHFELTGRFGGFMFTDAGKRRMLLRQGERDQLLKVPRVLRRRIVGKFRVGDLLHVAVTEEREPATGVVKRVVLRVLSDPTDFLVSPAPSSRLCVISVCSKKNCWRKGGRELWQALEQQLQASGHAGSIEIRPVRCLDRCEHAPNADCGNHPHSACSPRAAGSILAQAVNTLHRS